MSDVAQRSPLRVCHYSPEYGPFDRHVFHRKAKSLSQAGYEVTVVCSGQPEPVIRDQIRVLSLWTERKRGRGLGASVQRLLRGVSRVATILRFLQDERFDYIQTTNPIGGLLARAARAKHEEGSG